jgi:RHS repeat-associated protein
LLAADDYIFSENIFLVDDFSRDNISTIKWETPYGDVSLTNDEELKITANAQKQQVSGIYGHCETKNPNGKGIYYFNLDFERRSNYSYGKPVTFVKPPSFGFGFNQKGGTKGVFVRVQFSEDPKYSFISIWTSDGQTEQLHGMAGVENYFNRKYSMKLVVNVAGDLVDVYYNNRKLDMKNGEELKIGHLLNFDFVPALSQTNRMDKSKTTIYVDNVETNAIGFCDGCPPVLVDMTPANCPECEDTLAHNAYVTGYSGVLINEVTPPKSNGQSVQLQYQNDICADETLIASKLNCMQGASTPVEPDAIHWVYQIGDEQKTTVFEGSKFGKEDIYAAEMIEKPDEAVTPYCIYAAVQYEDYFVKTNVECNYLSPPDSDMEICWDDNVTEQILDDDDVIVLDRPGLPKVPFYPKGAVVNQIKGEYKPYAVAFDTNNNLCFSDLNSNKVYRIESNGDIVAISGTFNDPKGIAFNTQNILYVADFSDGIVYKVLDIVNNEVFADGLFGPYDITFDASDNLYVVDNLSGRVVKMHSDGELYTIVQGLYDPKGIAITNDNRLFITDRNQTEFSRISEILEQKSERYTYVDFLELSDLEFLDVNVINNSLFVTDKFSGNVWQVDKNGVRSLFQSSLIAPTGIAVKSESENVYIAETGTNRIIELSGNEIYVTYPETNEWIKRNDDNTFVLNPGDCFVHYYDADGDLITKEDKNGNITQYHYDSQKRVTGYEDNWGASWQIHYYKDSLISSVTDNYGRNTIFDYNDNDDLIRVTYPDDSFVEYKYNSSHLLTKITDKNGFDTEIYYDHFGRVRKVVSPSGSADVLSASYSSNLINDLPQELGTIENPAPTIPLPETKYINPDGYEVYYTYNKFGSPLTKLDRIYGVTRRWFNEYDLSGHLINSISPSGPSYSYEYNSKGNLIRETRIEDNAITQYEYGVCNNVTSIISPLGHRTKYEYDESGNRTKEVYPNGDKVQFAYTNRGLISTISNTNGATTHFSYNQNGKVLTIDRPLGNNTKYIYDNNNSRVTEVNSLGNKTVSEFDIMDRLISVTNASGNSTHYDYDNSGNLIEVIEPGSRITQYIYYPSGLLKKKIEPNDIVHEYTYTPLGKLSSISFADASNISYEYNILGLLIADYRSGVLNNRYLYDSLSDRLIKSTDRCGNESFIEYDVIGRVAVQYNVSQDYKTESTYDLNDQLTSIADENGNKTYYSYDETGRRTTISYPDGTEERIFYDSVNREITRRYSNGTEMIIQYDSSNRVSKINDSFGRVTHYHYNNLGMLTEKVLPDTNRIIYKYDEIGYLLETVLPNGQIIHREYDNRGNLISLDNGNGSTFKYQYDLNNRLVQEKDQYNNIKTFTYDKNNKLNSVNVNGLDEVIYTYTPDQLLSKVIYANGDFVSYNYDNCGFTNKIKNNSYEINYTLNEIGLITSEKVKPTVETTGFPNMSISYSYSNNGKVTEVVNESGHRYAIEYNSRGWANSLLTNGNRIYHFEYDSAGNILQEIYPTLIHTMNMYSNYNMIAQQNTNILNQVLNETIIQRDNNGNIIEAIVNGDKHEYQYDHMQRLLISSHPQDQHKTNPNEEYTYYPDGNRATSNSVRHYNNLDDSTLTVHYQYDNNRLLEDDIFLYNYDTNGNIIQYINKDEQSSSVFEYDAFDRLIQYQKKVKINDEIQIVVDAEYTYDPMGRRLSKEVNGVKKWYQYNGAQIDTEYDNSGNIIAQYIYNPAFFDRPMQMTRLGQTFYYVYDVFGNVTQLINKDGKVIQEYQYDAFGNQTLTYGQIENTFTYKGREYDTESGLYFFRNRVYDSKIGRFLQHDKLYTINPYSFVDNNPINTNDPFGLYTVPEPGDPAREYYLAHKDPDFNPGKLEAEYIDEDGCLWQTDSEANYMATPLSYICYRTVNIFTKSCGVETRAKCITEDKAIDRPNTTSWGNEHPVIYYFGCKEMPVKDICDDISIIICDSRNMTLAELALAYDPTPLSSGVATGRLYQLIVETKFGITDMDWAFTLLNLSLRTGASPLELYTFGKPFWVAIAKFDPEETPTMKKYFSQEETNAIKVANHLLMGNSFESLFPNYAVDCTECSNYKQPRLEIK